MSRAAMQQALDAIEGSGCKADLMAAADALRAALAEQERGPGWCPIHQHYKPCEHNTAKRAQPVAWIAPEAQASVVPQPLTIERLRDALVASRVIPPEAVEDADNYDDGVMLGRIEALFRRLG